MNIFRKYQYNRKKRIIEDFYKAVFIVFDFNYNRYLHLIRCRDNELLKLRKKYNVKLLDFQ